MGKFGKRHIEEEVAPVVEAPAGDKLIQPKGSSTGDVVYPLDNPIKE